MIRTIASVIRGEGLPSALRRANERMSEALHGATMRARGAFTGSSDAAILNVSSAGVSPRTGGVPAQLVPRLRFERALRSVALLHPGVLELSAPVLHSRRVTRFHPTRELYDVDFEAAIREALAITGARTIHLEGTSGVPTGSMLRLLDAGVGMVISVHDFSLFCARPHLLEQPVESFCFYSDDLDRCHRCLTQTWDVPKHEQAERRSLARRLLATATRVVFPSRFLLERHRELFSLPELTAEIIEPGVPLARALPRTKDGSGKRAIAYAGSVKRHKGAHLFPDIVRLVSDSSGRRDVAWHVFGGGDEDLLRAMLHGPDVTIHGYYRVGTLASLLARHDVGLVVLPSIVPESYGLTLSEAWLAGASAAAFDLGALAERIRRDGGGRLAPLDTGAPGLAAIVEQWLSEPAAPLEARHIRTAEDAAHEHVELYRRLHVLS